MASAAPSTHRAFAGVEYARVGGISLKLDLVVPEAAGDAAPGEPPAPAQVVSLDAFRRKPAKDG